jgi:hypothetical protein
VYVDQDLMFDTDGADEDELCSWDPIACVFSVNTSMFVAGDVRIRVLLESCDFQDRLLTR